MKALVSYVAEVDSLHKKKRGCNTTVHPQPHRKSLAPFDNFAQSKSSQKFSPGLCDTASPCALVAPSSSSADNMGDIRITQDPSLNAYSCLALHSHTVRRGDAHEGKGSP
eukprot:1196237-Prorocentrum_minimum.AAC.6